MNSPDVIALTMSDAGGRVVPRAAWRDRGDKVRPVRRRAVGLSPAAIGELGERLGRFCHRSGGCFRTATRDASGYAEPYVNALLRLDGQRTLANIGRQVGLLARTRSTS